MRGREDLRFAIELARESGAILMDYYVQPSRKRTEMRGIRDPITAADVESENHICARIRERHPHDTILAEEVDRGRYDLEACWIVDPLDGTVNFVHGIPWFTVSIALYTQGRGTLGVVYAPASGELYHAARGEGAYLNGRRLRVSRTSELSQALLATGFHYDRHRLEPNNVENFNTFILNVRGMRRSGCASLDLAYVAAGRYDGFWELWLGPYDVAAGAILVEEAGGRVTDFAGGTDYLFTGRIVATNRRIHEDVRRRLRG